MKCGGCGEKIAEAARFCSVCGENLYEAGTQIDSGKGKSPIAQSIIAIAVGLAIFGWGSGWFDNDSSPQPILELPVPQTAKVRKTTEHKYLSELALICRNAEQVPQFLTDLENDRVPNMNDCAINPTREQIRVEIIARRTIGQDALVHWRKPTTGFEGWTLESNLIID
jgi:hypothetical protein